jgi:hypothetical protein
MFKGEIENINKISCAVKKLRSFSKEEKLMTAQQAGFTHIDTNYFRNIRNTKMLAEIEEFLLLAEGKEKTGDFKLALACLNRAIEIEKLMIDWNRD